MLKVEGSDSEGRECSAPGPFVLLFFGVRLGLILFVAGFDPEDEICYFGIGPASFP